MNRRQFFAALVGAAAAPALPLKELLAEAAVVDCGLAPFSIPVFVNEARQPEWNQYPTPLQALDCLEREVWAVPEIPDGPRVYRMESE